MASLPGRRRAAALGDQFLWGRDLLVAPVYTKGASFRDVYLPGGTWYDWWTSAREAGGGTVRRSIDLATMPIYVRAGAIIPLDPVRQYVDERVAGPTTIRIYRGADGRFTLYEDDGASQEYLAGRADWTQLTWRDAANSLTIEPAAAGRTTKAPPRVFRVTILPDNRTKSVTYAGTRLVTAF